MTEQEIRLELAKAAIAAGADTKKGDEWYFWVMNTPVLNGEEPQDAENSIDAYIRDYEEEQKMIEKAIDNIIYSRVRISSNDARDAIVEIKNPSYCSLRVATLIARLFMPSKAKEEIVEALETGEIKGRVPQKREIQCSHCRNGEFKRQQPIGNYQFITSSLLKWLTNRYQCRVNDGFLTKIISDCIKNDEYEKVYD